jgi:hypothetical protein
MGCRTPPEPRAVLEQNGLYKVRNQMGWVQEMVLNSIKEWLNGVVSSIHAQLFASKYVRDAVQISRLLVKKRDYLFGTLSAFAAVCWLSPWMASLAWVFLVGSIFFYFFGVIALFSLTTQRIQREIANFEQRMPTGTELVSLPNMATFVIKKGVNLTNTKTVIRFFMNFAIKYGLALNPAGVKKNRRSLQHAVQKMLGEATFVTEVNRKMQDYIITMINFDEVVDDMTSVMKEFCSEESFKNFRGTIADAVKRGLKLCATNVYEDSVNVLSVTEDSFFLVAFTLKIYRTNTGWIVSTPVITGKYASFLLRVATAEFMKAIDFHADKKGASGNAIVLSD